MQKEPLRALIVDDDISFAKVLQIRLTGWCNDIEITFAYSIGEAEEQLKSANKHFDLAILDQHLPDGRGVDISEHPALKQTTILAVSSDDSPELPARTVKAGAQHFLGKRQVTTALFIPLIEALLERKKLEQKLHLAAISQAKMDSIKVLISTLKHEINNPLGAVLGAAYLIRAQNELPQMQREAVSLIEQSGERIKHVLEQLCDAAELETVTKAHEQLFHVPGDKPWNSN
ncbi:MAG: response regulator [Deltaproteobacteria bacterium]|nr:response regulator [Deltaproteobacteria bacterium]